jgi:hypothetical protein
MQIGDPPGRHGLGRSDLSIARKGTKIYSPPSKWLINNMIVFRSLENQREGRAGIYQKAVY